MGQSYMAKSPFFLKTLDPKYEMELSTRLARHQIAAGRQTAQIYQYFSVEYRRSWPNEDGIYEPPRFTITSVNMSELLDIILLHADRRDSATDNAVYSLLHGSWPGT